MKSDIQKLEGLSRKLQVEVPADIVNAALDKMYKEVQRKAKFAGFRPGKAPIEKVKSQYKTDVEYDVVDRIVREHYTKALDEHDIYPVSMPAIDFEPLKANEPFKFTAVFEVRPDVKLKKYKGLEVEKEILDVKDEVVDKIIEDIRSSKATIVPVIELRAAQLGDMAVIDFEGKIDGELLPGGTAKEHMLELGSKNFIEGFEEGIIGMNPGDKKTIHLKFPENYQEVAISGKPVDFEVTLKEIKKKVLPVMDDEFAKTLGNHDSVSHLRAEVKKDVTQSEEKRVKDDLKTRILQALVTANDFEVPQSMLKEQKDILIEDVHGRMKQDGMTESQFEDYKVKWDADFNKSAKFIVCSSMLVNTVAKEEKLLATPADFEERMEKYAKQSGMEIEKIKAFYAKDENKSRVMFQLTEEKVMELLIAESKIKELPKSKLTKAAE